MDQSLHISRHSVCVCLCVYIYIYIERERERETERETERDKTHVFCVQRCLKDIMELVPDHLNNVNIAKWSKSYKNFCFSVHIILSLYYSLHYAYKVHTLIFKYFILTKKHHYLSLYWVIATLKNTDSRSPQQMQ